MAFYNERIERFGNENRGRRGRRRDSDIMTFASYRGRRELFVYIYTYQWCSCIYICLRRRGVRVRVKCQKLIGSSTPKTVRFGGVHSLAFCSSESILSFRFGPSAPPNRFSRSCLNEVGLT